MEDLHALQQQQYEGYLHSPEQARIVVVSTGGTTELCSLNKWLCWGLMLVFDG